MTITDTKKAPVAPTTGTAAAAAPTATTNSTDHQNEGTHSIMTQTTSKHEDVLRNLSNCHIDVRHVITDFSNDWTRKGDEFHYRLFAITVDPTCNIIIARLYCDTPRRRHQMLEKAHALRNGTFLDGESIDAFKIIEHEDGAFSYRITYSNILPAVTCERDGCIEKGEVLAEGNHCCTLDVPESVAQYGVSVFFDDETGQWLVDVNVATSDYINSETALLTAKALTEAAKICDRYNGSAIRRPVEACAAPEHAGVL